MRTFLSLLRDGLRLALLRAPRNTPLDAGFATWLALALLGVLIDALWHWPLVDPPRIVDGFGVQTALAAGLLRLAASAAICALMRRRALFWTVAGWLEAAALPVAAVSGSIYVGAQDSRLPLEWFAWVLTLVWLLLILVRLAAFLQPTRVLHTAVAAMMAFTLLVAPWQWMEAQLLWTTDWSEAEGDEPEAGYEIAPGALAEPEATMYAQPERLAQALAQLAPQRPDRIDLYALAFGGDASENVFRNEVEYFERLMPQRFDAGGHTLGLLNHPDTNASRPLATATNLERMLLALGERMDREQDILFLYMTSHGSPAHEIYVNQPPLPLDQLTPQRLRAALDASGIRWRVLVLSACYSGGYVEALRDPDTLVITAARADRASFGCGTESEITWFGKAYLAEALNSTTDFVQAFEQARKQIANWEKADEVEASHPQLDAGDRIGPQLERWRAGFESGAPLPFAPAASAPAIPD